MAEPDGVPQEAWIRLGAVQEIVRTPKRELFHRKFVWEREMPYSPYFTTTRLMRRHQGLYKAAKNTQVARPCVISNGTAVARRAMAPAHVSG